MSESPAMKRVGIVAHSAEGGALCFVTACRVGDELLGTHLHPEIVLSAVPMAWSIPGWEADDHDAVGSFLMRGIRQVADAGADFYVCPNNTAHIVLQKIAAQTPIPGLHIAEVVCDEIAALRRTRVGVLGTEWTMTGPIYAQELERRGMQKLIPEKPVRDMIHTAILDELCRGVFEDSTTTLFVEAIEGLRERGAECVVLGCTEIPLIITEENSPLPVLDSTRLLARRAVEVAVESAPLRVKDGWVVPGV